MKVAVMSPFHRSGLTTVATLLGLTLNWTQNVTTVMSYTGDSDMASMLGTFELDDKTRSITQLAKLLRERAIGAEQITEYCVPLGKDIHLMDTTSNILTLKDKANIVSFVFDQVPTDFVVCECDGDLSEPDTQEIVKTADVVIMVFEPYRKQFDGVKEYLQDPDWPKDKRVMYLCNKYEDLVMPLRDISKDFGVKHVDMCKLHYNPWIMKMCESGKAGDLLTAIIEKDPRVVNLNIDLWEWMTYFMAINNAKVKWEG